MKYAVCVWLCLASVAQAGILSDAIERAQRPSAADVQATPADQVATVLARLKLTPEDVLVDYGCGDARVLIAAVRAYGCRGVGVEIDPDQFRAAQLAVEAAGVSDRVELRLGDAVTADIKATAGFCYLWPDTLEQLAPKLTQLKRFASYQHAVPGLEMTRRGDAWYWESSDKHDQEPVVEYTTQRVLVGYRSVRMCNGRQCWYERQPVYETRRVKVEKPAEQKPAARAQPVQKPVAYWKGRAYTGRVCSSPNCTMCNSISAQLGQWFKR